MACNSLCKNSGKVMGKGGKALRFLFGVAALVGVLLLFVGIGIVAETTKSLMVVSSAGEFKHWEFVAETKLNSHDFHYVSKRRVPNGPDPIHNRRASMSRQPPGRI